RSEFRKRPPHGMERADFEHLAFGGLLESIDRYDPLLGVPFDAYARRRIRGAIADGMNHASESASQYAYQRRVERERLWSLQEESAKGDAVAQLANIAFGLAIGLIAENASALAEDVAASAYDTQSWRELEQSVLKEIERLPPAERTVVMQH